ncbi:MAG TPA: PfkB family carbohydrate kinase [Kofleriaceae bacterium]|nr:PfkB family carbohydrate kinase [Kofleriaceae bacterium]
MSRPGIVGLGRAAIEILGVLPRIPDDGREIELSEISVQVGGTAAVATATAAALGCRARFLCPVADDFFGAFVRCALEEAGVEVLGQPVSDARLTATRVALTAREPRRRLSCSSPGDAGELLPEDFDPRDLIAAADAVIIDGTCPRAQAAVAEQAKSRDIPVIFDASDLREGTGALVALADVLICSERLAAELSPRDALPEALQEIRDLGPRAVVITMGRAGSIGLSGDKLVEQPAFAVDTVDAANAGAVYHGGFAAALLSGLPLSGCMELAAAAAALSCRSLGAFAGIPSRDEVVATIRGAVP